MKNLKFLLLAMLTIALTNTSCIFDGDNDFFDCERGTGDIETRTLDMSEFTGVKMTVSGEVFITQGNDFEVKVRGQENILDLLEIDIQNDTWEIEFDKCVRNIEGFEVFITMPEIQYLAVSGSGLIRGENTFELNDLETKITGSGDIDLSLEADQIESKISGSGKLFLEGTATNHTLKINGSGDLRAFDLEAEDTSIEINGSGDAEVRVNDDLDVDIAGSGDVLYKGEPSISVKITGSGEIINAN